MSDELEKLREELAEANARRDDLRTALEWSNEERDRLREQLAAKHSDCPDCADYAARSGRFAEQADRLQRERDEARAEVATAAKYCDELAETIRMHIAREIELEAEVERLREGFRRGAEAMRAQVMNWLVRAQAEATVIVVDTAIRSVDKLPIPEER